MTIAELIEELSLFPMNAEVIGHDDGFIHSFGEVYLVSEDDDLLSPGTVVIRVLHHAAPLVSPKHS